MNTKNLALIAAVVACIAAVTVLSETKTTVFFKPEQAKDAEKVAELPCTPDESNMLAAATVKIRDSEERENRKEVDKLADMLGEKMAKGDKMTIGNVRHREIEIEIGNLQTSRPITVAVVYSHYVKYDREPTLKPYKSDSDVKFVFATNNVRTLSFVCESSVYYDDTKTVGKPKVTKMDVRKDDGWECTLWVNSFKVYEKRRGEKGKFFIGKGSCGLGAK